MNRCALPGSASCLDAATIDATLAAPDRPDDVTNEELDRALRQMTETARMRVLTEQLGAIPAPIDDTDLKRRALIAIKSVVHPRASRRRGSQP